VTRTEHYDGEAGHGQDIDEHLEACGAVQHRQAWHAFAREEHAGEHCSFPVILRGAKRAAHVIGGHDQTRSGRSAAHRHDECAIGTRCTHLRERREPGRIALHRLEQELCDAAAALPETCA